MRAVAGAYYIMMNTFIGLALGPYVIGKISDVFVASGSNSAESLQMAITIALGMFAASLLFLTLAWRWLPKEEATRVARARSHGEEVPASAG